MNLQTNILQGQSKTNYFHVIHTIILISKYCNEPVKSGTAEDRWFRYDLRKRCMKEYGR